MAYLTQWLDDANSAATHPFGPYLITAKTLMNRLTELSCSNQINPYVLSWTLWESQFSKQNPPLTRHSPVHNGCRWVTRGCSYANKVFYQQLVSVLVLGFFSLSTVVNCVFSLVSERVVVCCCVSLKITPCRFINSSCQAGLGAWGLQSRFVCLTLVEEAADKNQKGQKPVRRWHSAANCHLSSSCTGSLLLISVKFLHVCECVCILFLQRLQIVTLAPACPFDDLTYFVSVKVLADPIFEEMAPNVARKWFEL